MVFNQFTYQHIVVFQLLAPRKQGSENRKMVTKKQMVENHQTLVGSALLGWTTTGAFAFLKWASLPKQEADTDAIGRRRRGRRTRIVAVSLPQNNLSGRSAQFWAVHMDTEFGTPLCGDGVHAWTSA